MIVLKFKSGIYLCLTNIFFKYQLPYVNPFTFMHPAVFTAVVSKVKVIKE